MPNTTGTTINTCSGTFYDPGGSGGSYGNNNFGTVTFCSNTPGGQLIFNFTQWALEMCCDYLTIYNGPNTASPVIFNGHGSTSPGVITSTSGCITFRWDSDGSVVGAGWTASITCISCSDGIQNGNETAVDCGGSCPSCSDCNNGIQDGNETGVDCGPTCPEPCHCSDGVLSGNETDVDCGGSCNPCPVPCSVSLTYSTPTYDPPPVAGPAYNMPNTTGAPISTCGGTFHDPGGAGGSYGNNNFGTQTFCAGTPGGQLEFIFTQWALETCCDYMTIYDGPNTSSPQIFYGHGSTSPGTVTSTSGCLTFVWDSDGSVVGAGWSATINCVDVPQPLDCNGGNILLTAVGQGEYTLVLNNDFDAGSAGTGWNTNINADYNNPCQPSVDGGTYMWMGSSAPHPRILETVPLDVSCGGEICFYLDFATQGQAAPCEGPDLAGEGVYFEYSTNGGATWTQINYFHPNGGYDPIMTAWNQYCFTIPAAAETPNTLFHWAQTGSSGAAFDNWGLDNVTISSLVNCAPYVYDYAHIPGGDNGPTDNESLTSTTTYTVTYTNGVDACSTSITVPIPPGPTANAGPDVIRCFGGGPVTIGANPVTPTNGATFSWSSGAGSGTIDNIAPGIVTGQVSVSPAVTTTYTLSVTSAGCTTTDQVTVTVDNPPTASNPPPIVVQCASALPAPNVAVVTTEADDFTIPPTVTYIGEVINVAGCPQTRTRTYRVTDGCGNFVDVFQTITIDPTTNPVVPAPGGSMVSCPANALVQPAAPVVTDVCGNVLTPIVVAPPAVGCEGTMTWQFNYTDCSGNTAQWTYVYTIDRPAFTVPANATSTVNCLANATAPVPPAVNDACGTAIAPVMTQNANPACEGNKVYTFTYTDCAGNVAVWTHTYTIDIPAFTVPANGSSTVNCLANATAPVPPAVNNACGTALVPVMTQGANPACEGTKVYTFTYTDCAGNTAAWTYTYTIDMPAFALPANGASTVNCLVDAQVQPAAPVVTDVCGNNIVPVVTTPANIVCEGDMTWVFTYSDCAGNTSVWNYTYTVDLPTFTLPANAASTVNCLADAVVPVAPAMNDLCGNAIVPVMSQNADPACEGAKVYTFTYTDCAGNTADWVYTYTIDIPAFTVPANGSEAVVCIGDVYVPVPPAVNDMCGNAVVPVMTQNADPVCVGDKVFTFTYTDCAGNVAVWTYTFSINDNVPPTGTAPADISITSLDPFPPANPLLITDEADNCGIAPTVTHVGDVSDFGTCPEIITRTYEIEDACGNSILVSHTITIGDANFPTASNPLPITVECLADVPAPDVTVVTDEADDSGVPTVTFESDSPSGSCPTTIDRVYRVTDNCGNFIFVNQTITVVPSTNPVVPANGASTVNCLVNAQVQPAAPVVTDVCGNVLVPVVTTPSNILCEGTMSWVFTYTDCAGNSSVWNYTYTVDLPTFTLPANAASTVNCLANAVVPVAPAMNDLCGNALVPVMAQNADPACEGDKVFTFTYTDCAGNTADWVYTYTIDIPAFTVPANGSEAVVCIGDVYVPVPPAVNDMCGNAVVPVMTQNVDPVCVGDKVYTFTYTDCAGNVAVWTYNFSINDNVPPTGTAPANISITNLDPIPPANPLLITDEADNCGIAPTVTHVSDLSDFGTCPEIITRTYEIEDACGNSILVSHTIAIGDAGMPTASDPLPITVECLADVPAPDVTVVTDEADDSGVPTVTFESDTPSGSCPTTIDRVYRVTDNCGNFIFVNQTITVVPSTNPVVPANGASTVNCLVNAQVQPAAPVVTDVCGNVLVPVVTTPSNILCEGTMSWVFTYADCAGNSSVWNYTYTVVLPTFTLPVNAASTVNCLANAVVPAAPAVNDLCGNAIVPVMSQNADPACEGAKVYTFTYTDCAGNTADWVYTYTIDIPAFTVPANGSEAVVCIGDVYVPVPPAVNDMCGNAVVPVMTQNADPVCVGDKVFTFTYSDCAGNLAVWTYTFSINDNVPPTGTAPANINLVLGNPIPAADPLLITNEADNCGLVPTVVHVSDVSDNGDCPEIITRTYEIEDACGNTTLVTQLITIGDAVLPTASNPLPITVECLADVPAPDITLVTDEADNGPVPTVLWESDTQSGSCPTTIDRVYRVTDNCGNFIFVTQTITIVPSTNPVVPTNGASTVNCLANAQVQPAAPVVTDVCGNNIVPVVTTPANIVCEGTMTWVFTYSDCAGNANVWNYTYTVVLPTFTVPADQAESVVCFADIYVPTAPVVADFCGNNIVPVMTQSADPVCAGDKVYTFTYTNCAGNVDVWTYTFTINDNIAPTGSNPVNISVAGAILVPAPDVTAVTDEADNCTLVPVVAWVSDVSDGNVCNNEVITRTYSITDDCGNSILVTQQITILAVPPPIDAGPDTLVCADGIALLTADNPWSVPFSWDNGITDGVGFNPPGTTVYTVTANNYGCISTDQVTVNVEQLPVVSFFGDVLAGCEPVTTTFTNTSSGGSPLVNCVWTFSNGATLAGCNQVTYTFQNGGLYDVTLTTTSATGCVNTATYFDYVYVENIPDATFSVSSTVLSTIDTEVEFNNTSTNATNYVWSFGDGTQSTTQENPTHTFPSEGSGSYIVELIATSPLGCVDTTWQVIQVIEEVIFYVPNTFTPDGDNYNEYFQAIFTSGYDPYDFTLLIFNRWGEIIWESHNVDVGWDGTYGGMLVPDGTYTWTIEFKTSNNDERMAVNGHVNVIK